MKIKNITDDGLLEDHISTCKEELDQLPKTLMSLELELVDQLEVRMNNAVQSGGYDPTFRLFLMIDIGNDNG